MNTWLLQQEGFNKTNAAVDGSRFLCSNGYLGLRGMPEEAASGLFPAITLAGVYDQFADRWREPVNAPNCLYIQASLDGRSLSMEEAQGHCAKLDYRHGIYSRETRFGQACISSRRFVSMASPHLLADEYRITFLKAGESNISVTLAQTSGATAIESLTPNPSSKGEGNIYSLNGQRVMNPSAGVYIKNGKKVIL